MARKKIALIGAGNIGGELANLCVSKQLGDVVLFDIKPKESFAKGKALDLEQASALSGSDASVVGSSDWKDCAGADVLIITAGIPRKPGQSRDDLVAMNLPIIRDVADNAKEHCPNAFVIVISNPLDAMVYTAWKASGFPTSRILGQAGALDVEHDHRDVDGHVGEPAEETERRRVPRLLAQRIERRMAVARLRLPGGLRNGKVGRIDAREKAVARLKAVKIRPAPATIAASSQKSGAAITRSPRVMIAE